jgi:PKD repeat protein
VPRKVVSWRRGLWAATLALCAMLSACGSAERPQTTATSLAAVPTKADLLTRFHDVCRQLGKDPLREPAKAPVLGSQVFDLTIEPIDPDGAGPLEPTGNKLAWTEQLLGDYNYDGQVSINDLTPLSALFNSLVTYDDPAFHAGIAWWPSGHPEQDNGLPPSEQAQPGSGARNWWLARVDGDSNGLVNINDITPLGAHLGARLDGYRVYRLGPGEAEFVLLPDPQDPLAQLTVSRAAAGPKVPAAVSALRPVRYSFTDTAAPGTGYEYRVAPFDEISGDEGPQSISAANSVVTAVLEIDPEGGAAPLSVSFDASQSTSTAGAISIYEWDFQNDGVIDLTGPEAQVEFTYNVTGSFVAVVQATDADGNSAAAGRVISVGLAPTAVLHALPSDGEVPVAVRYDATQSLDPDGEIVVYQWDLDGNGSFEVDTGPVPFRVVNYTAAGTHNVGVRVVDSQGAVDSTYVSIDFHDEYGEIEPNDSVGEAQSVGSLAVGASFEAVEGSLGAAGYDGDDADWYRIAFASGGVFTASLNFTHSAADLNLRLFAADGTTQLGAALGTSNSEQIQYGVKGAWELYLRVERFSGGGPGADYALQGTFAPIVYTEVEQNDSRTSATSLGTLDGTLLADTWGNLGPGGLDGDSIDWYRVEVQSAVTLRVQLCFAHHDADLDLQVYGGDGSQLFGESRTVTDNEEVLFEAAPGSYFIRAFRHQGGTANYILNFSIE